MFTQKLFPLDNHPISPFKNTHATSGFAAHALQAACGVRYDFLGDSRTSSRELDDDKATWERQGGQGTKDRTCVFVVVLIGVCSKQIRS